MTYRVQFAPEARDQLEEIERFIIEAGSPVTAARYVDAIVNFCLRLQTFPERGVARDDLLPGPTTGSAWSLLTFWILRWCQSLACSTADRPGNHLSPTRRSTTTEDASAPWPPTRAVGAQWSSQSTSTTGN
ncbi:plasmid stabilization system protein ParE [Paraburkholderia sp. GAS448]|uniref:type II toxin-antitoxin system RelE/ParE family toxin n=1 Tax=Paraburkholderia sp. GAS448 TaxID=3035136 RepID=UPI003D21B15D